MSVPYIQANINGTLQSAAVPAIAPINRGFLYGDAIYEVWRTYRGVIFAWEEHWARLGRSAKSLHLSLPFDAGYILTEIRRTAKAFREQTGDRGELYIRLQITRGGGPIGLDPALADATDFVVLVQRLPLPSDEVVRTGLRLSLGTGLHRNTPGSLDPAWKTGNYLNNILCLREARARGADEVVITNQAGEIAEAAVCNLAFVRAGEVLTPPLNAGILGGITREILLSRVGPAAGITVREAVLKPEDLASMEECLLLSTTRDLQAVREIDSVTYRTGEGTVGWRLKQAFGDYAANSAREHPELAV